MDVVIHRKAETEKEVGAPLQGSLSKILVSPGDAVDMNTPFIIEAMKMESTITSPVAGYGEEGTPEGEKHWWSRMIWWWSWRSNERGVLVDCCRLIGSEKTRYCFNFEKVLFN